MSSRSSVQKRPEVMQDRRTGGGKTAEKVVK